MANVKTTDETAASTLDGTEAIRGVQAGGMVKIIISQILAYIAAAKTFANATFTGTTTFSGGAGVLDASSGDGTISATGGGKWIVSAILKLLGAVQDTAGGVGSAGQTLKSNGSGLLTYSNDLGCYVLTMGGTSLATLAQNATWYTGWLLGGSPAQVNQGRYKIYIPKTGVIRSFTFHLYGAGGEAAKNLTVDLWLNNATSIGQGAIASNVFPGQYAATGLSQAVTGWNGATGDYIELRVSSPATMTSITNGAFIAEVFIESPLV